MRYKDIKVRAATGRDAGGEYVQAKALNVIARYYGGEYIELRWGTSGPAFHVLNTTAYVARELEAFLKEEKQNLPGYLESVGLYKQHGTARSKWWSSVIL